MCIPKANFPDEDAQRHHLSRRLHSLPEAEVQDNDDDHQAEQQLPLGQADVVDPAALVQVKDTAPVSKKEDSAKEDDQVPSDGGRIQHSLTLGLLSVPVLASYGLHPGWPAEAPLTGPGDMMLRQGRPLSSRVHLLN